MVKRYDLIKKWTKAKVLRHDQIKKKMEKSVELDKLRIVEEKISFTVVLGATILGFQKHGLEFLHVY